MSKKIRSILVGLAVLLVLTGVSLTLVLWPKAPEETPSTVTPVPTVDPLVGEDALLQTMQVTNEKGSYVIDKVGARIWKVTDLTDFSQLTTTIEVLVNTLSDLTPVELVEENSTDLAQYGLQSPVVSVKMTFEDGDKYEVQLGDYTYNKQHFYVRLANSRDVYIVGTDKLDALLKNSYTFLDHNIYPALPTDTEGNPEYPQINTLTIARKDLEEPMTFNQVDPDAPDTLNAYATLGLRMESPVQAELISEPCFATFFSCFGLSGTEILATNPTAEQLETYGLQDPQASFYIRFRESSELKLMVGHGIDQNGEIAQNVTDIVSYYLMREGTDIVYLVNRTAVPWVEIQPNRFVSALAMVPNLVDLSGTTVTLDGKKYEFEIILPEGAENTDELEAKVNGQTVDPKQFKQYMQLLYFTGIQGINKTVVPQTSPRAVFKYRYPSGRVEMVEIFVEADTTTIVSVNGNNSFFGRSIYIDKLKTEMEHLLAGEKVSSDW